MTLEQLLTEINDRQQLTRADVQQVLQLIDDPNNQYVEMQTFLEGVAFLNQDQKIMVLNDLDSYV